MYIVFVIWVSKRRYKFFVIWFSPRVSIMHGQRVNLIAYVDVWVNSMPCMGECIVECEGTRAMSRHPTLHDPTDIPLSKSDPIGQSGLATPRGSGWNQSYPLNSHPPILDVSSPKHNYIWLYMHCLWVLFVIPVLGRIGRSHQPEKFLMGLGVEVYSHSSISMRFFLLGFALATIARPVGTLLGSV